ncbi:glycosyltransferase family 39 protein [Patescibacteria group bacterium]
MINLLSPNSGDNLNPDIGLPRYKNWRIVIKLISFIGMIGVIALLVGRYLLVEKYFWLSSLDEIVLVLLFIDFLVLYLSMNFKTAKIRSILYWLLSILLMMNFVWGIAQVNYPQVDLYSFNIDLNYILIIAGLLLIPITKTKKATFFIGLIIFLLLPDTSIYPLLLISLLVFLFIREFVKTSQITIPREVIVRLLIGFLGLLFLINLMNFIPTNILSDAILIIDSIYKYHLYIITLILAIVHFHILHRVENDRIKPSISQQPSGKKPWPIIIGLGVVTIIYLFFSFQSWRFISIGETKWLNLRNDEIVLVEGYDDISPEVVKETSARCESYWTAYLAGNIKATFNNPNPNASLCFYHLPGYLTRNVTSLDQYILIARVTIIVHNLLILYLIFYLLNRLLSAKQALIITGLMGLQPLFIGYSRVYNHDAIQGLYAVSFILSLLLALKSKSRKHLALAGAMFSLALFTQFKTQYIVPLLFIMPIIGWYLWNDKKIISFLARNLSSFYKAAIIITIIIIPAVLVFPKLIIDRFFFYYGSPMVLLATFFAIILFLTAYYRFHYITTIFKYIKKLEKYFVRIFIIALLGLFITILWQQDNIFSNYLYQYFLPNFRPALWTASSILFYSLPPIVLLFLIFWLIKYYIKPKIDFSSLFVILFFLSFILIALNSMATSNKLGDGFVVVGSKYVFTILPLLIIGLGASITLNKMSYKRLSIIFIFIISSLVFSNLSIAPFYHDYSNFLLPDNQINARSSWATDTGILADYINSNFANVEVYHPKGTLGYLVREDIKVISWSDLFWEENPDYIIVTWDKTHRYAKIFDYYRYNLQPIWSIEHNGVVYVGIYNFDPSIDYDQLFEETIEFNKSLQNYFD